jgi:hypothetical protein
MKLSSSLIRRRFKRVAIILSMASPQPLLQEGGAYILITSILPPSLLGEVGKGDEADLEV